jgi:hypothetical protein
LECRCCLTVADVNDLATAFAEFFGPGCRIDHRERAIAVTYEPKA